jgi:EF-P beta-lysylation protein EpmB
LKKNELSIASDGSPLPGGPIVTTGNLLHFLELESLRAPYRILDAPDSPLLVPLSFAARMRKRDWFDPLLLQILPRGEELAGRKGFTVDPVHDAAAAIAPCLLKKYSGRALLLAGDRCAMTCRYCFRRRRGAPLKQSFDAIEAALLHIGRDASLREVILSGGDPLCLVPEKLERIARLLADIPHCSTVRIHTRLPVADPDRVDAHLATIAFLSTVRTCIVVIHANHEAELGGGVPAALLRLRSTGCLLLNQSVLLRHINDCEDRLAKLSCALLDSGVMPYYLHQLDRVEGAWHFETGVRRGRELMAGLRRLLPGYAVPRYVREIAGEPAKTPL